MVSLRPRRAARVPLPGAAQAQAPGRLVVLSFAATTTLLVLVAVVAGFASYQVAGGEVRDDAVGLATRMSASLIGPEAVRAERGDPSALDALEHSAAERLVDGSVSQITVWRADGTVVWSSDGALVGKRSTGGVPFGAVAAGEAYTEFDDTDDEFGSTPRDRRVVEVYVPITSSGGRLLLEVHGAADEYRDRTVAVALPLIGLAVLPLLLAELIQVPIALSLLRRIRAEHDERSRLLEYALSASDRERREIAAGLHDTVVQNLAGAGYALSSLERDVPTERRPGARAALSSVQESVESLRGLLVDLHPSDLTATALPGALEVLLAPLRQRGLDVTASVSVPAGVHDAVAVVLYRIIREWLVHLTDHAQHLRVEVGPDGPGVLMRVTDDAPTPLLPDTAHPDETSRLGLALLRDRVTALGGTFEASPQRDGGTEIVVAFPAR